MRAAPLKISDLFDADRVRDTLTALYKDYGSDTAGLRAAALATLKTAMADARTRTEVILMDDGHGLDCARRLSAIQDALIQVIYEFAVTHIYRAQNPSAAERLTVVAVGGYGRDTLAPGSDIDLLFLRPYKQTPWGESLIEFMLYMLWDLGFKVGHATRTVNECVRLSRADMTIRTSILEARYVWGDEALFEELRRRFDKDVVAGTGPAFVEAKLKERDERHDRVGTSRYLVEPNVKEGKGGLRDLQTLFWIAQYFYRVEHARDLVKAGVFTRSEFNTFRKCGDFLWAVRCHLHFMTGRAEERLSFELQREMATRLNYTAHPGVRDVERFMKHYFLIAKEVGDLTRIFCASLELRHAKAPGMLSQVMTRLRGQNRPRTIKGTKDFVVEAGRITVADDTVFERDPVNLIRIFRISGQNDLLFHPDVLTLIRRSLKLIDAKLRQNKEANKLFLEILTSKKNGPAILRRMNEAGVLGRFILDFGRIVSLVQFNMYHHYTVDEHLIYSVAALAEIERGERGEEHPLAHSIISTVDRTILYVTIFLHDIAKGRPEDHSIAGARIARRLCPRFGLSPAETETVAWLVEHHLLMSNTAQSRDITDPKTITDFAAVVQSLERLKLLLILTVADIRAVGPGVWNGWKGQLLRSLYYETERVVSGGHTQGHSHRVEAAKAELRDLLADWTDAEFDTYQARHSHAYWLKVEPAHMAEHAHLIRETEARGDPFAASMKTDAFQAITEVTIIAPDNRALLSLIAGACAANGANIVDATAFTTNDGLAVDSVFFRRSHDTDEDELAFAGRIINLVEACARGEVRLTDRVAKRLKRAPRGRLKAFSLETQVTVSNTWSNRYTVIEVSGLDRPGLLFDLTSAMARLNLDIASAHVVTFGERAVDVFYVTDLMGEKIMHKTRQATIKRQIAAAFDGPGTAKAKPARAKAS